MVHVIGRTWDLERHERRPDHVVFDDVHSCWSPARNDAWMRDAVQRDEVFLRVSPNEMGSVLALEIEHLHAAGYVAIGPLFVPAAWRASASSYRTVVRLVAEHVLELDRRLADAFERVYVEKVHAELEPLLELWPHVVVLPTTRSFTLRELILCRAFSVHPLGVVAAPAWTDGALRSPADFFFHDIDHARFKIREDLAAVGVAIPDAYRGGSTLDPVTGQHRSFLHAAVEKIDATSSRVTEERAMLALALLHEFDRDSDRTLAEACELLLFEIVHEKSFPLAPAILSRELSTPAHTDKLCSKHARGFFGPYAPAEAVVARLDEARALLAARIATKPR